MTKKEKEFYKNKKPIGVKCTSNFGGIAIKELTDDYVIFEGELGDLHTSKVYYNVKGESYFKYYGRREYFNEYMRV